MAVEPITPLKSERIQRTLPTGWTSDADRAARVWELPDAGLAAQWAGFLAALAARLDTRPSIRIEGQRVELALSEGSEVARGEERRLLGVLAAL